MYRATLLMIIGFLLFFFGFIALVLMFVGLQLSYLTFIDTWGRTAGFAIRLLMIFGGVALVYVNRGKFSN